MVSTQILCRLKPVVIGMFCLFLTSCATYRTISIDVMQAAEIELGQGKKNIAFLDRNIHRESDTSQLLFHLEGITRADLGYLLFCGLNELDQIDKFDSIPSLDTPPKSFIKSHRLPVALTSGELVNLYYKTGLDYLISLEGIYYNLGEKKISGDCFIRLYSLTDGQCIDSILYREDLTEAIEYDSFVEVIQKNTYQKGIIYLQRIAPHWIYTERRIYNSTKALGMGDFFYQKGETEEALKIWESIMQQGGKRGIKASLNIAWIYENAGDFQHAAEILKNGMEIADKSKINGNIVWYLKHYLNMVEKRITDSNILPGQI